LKKIIILSLISILILTFSTGCGGTITINPSGEATPAAQLKIINGAPVKAPGLMIGMIHDNVPEYSEQYTHAIQLTTSWSITYEDGTGTGYESDSPHALQLGAEYFTDAFLLFYDSYGIVEMQFSDNFPPETISVQRWNAVYATGNQDIEGLLNMGESVDVTENTFLVVDDGNDYVYEVYARWQENGSSWYTFRINTKEDFETVDLGCCMTDIKARENALLGENSVTYEKDDFIMTLNSDKHIYSSTDAINIWGTIEYTGEHDSIEIHSSCTFMLFTISGGDLFADGMGGAVADVLAVSILEKGNVYHFDYQKSGGWDADDPNAEIWDEFFSSNELKLPAGEYTITLNGSFTVPERSSNQNLIIELTIIVT